MDQPAQRSPARRWSIVSRVVAGVVAALTGAVFVASSWLALSSRFGWNDRDLHGYGLIFGTVIAVMAALVVAVALPLALPPHHRPRASAVSIAAFALVLILLIASLVTA